jgi:hypothetical protein
MEENKLLKVYDYKCKECNKGYTSYQSLWNHNKKFHTNNSCKVLKSSDNCSEKVLIKSEIINLDKSYYCRCCNKIFHNVKTRWSHEKVCKQEKNSNNDIIKLKEETKQKEIDLEIKKQEKEILKLKLKLEKSEEVDNVTIRKLNKKLMARNKLIKNSTVNSHNIGNNSNNNNKIQNNYITNTFQLVGYGKEDYLELLTMKEKKEIINSRYCCLEKLIEIINCGIYDQFKNIIITNAKDNYLYKYDELEGKFMLSSKSEILNDLVTSRVTDIEIMYNELVEKNKINEKTKLDIEKFISKFYNNDIKFNDCDGKEYQSYKHFKINEVKVLLFNNSDKITNDISLLLTTTQKDIKTPKIEEIDL